MRILVTGSTGLVGGAIVGRLLEDGHEVVGLSRRGDEQLPRSLAVDLSRPGSAERLAAEPPCEAIVHAAAALTAPAAEVTLTNALGTQQMLELASRWQTRRFVFLSSLPVIGRPQELPISEDHPVDPLTPYHASKVYGEQLVRLAAAAGLPAISLRLTAPVGAGMPPGRILSAFVINALRGDPLDVAGDGTRRQDYVDVRDVAAAVSGCIEQGVSGLLNVASGRSISNLELAHTCIEVLGSSSEVRRNGLPDPEDGVDWEVSIAQAQALIGYRPRHSVADSIRAVADFVQVRAGV